MRRRRAEKERGVVYPSRFGKIDTRPFLGAGHVPENCGGERKGLGKIRQQGTYS